MLRRTMAAVFATCFVMAAGAALAQPCSVGVYADAAGTSSVFQPTQGQAFDIYVVAFAEDLVNAASYSLDVPGLNTDVFVVSSAWGPDGGGINIGTVNGENVGLGECAVGYTGLPVLVATYSLIIPLPAPARTISVAGNADEDPQFPVISNCQGVLTPCGIGPSLEVDQPVATEAASFGAVKSLYGN